MEMNPGDAGTSDRLVVQEVIKTMAQSPPIDAATGRTFKVIVLNEVDGLSKEAQHALRRTMEKYSSSCRIIMVCNSTSKVIEPIRSRCLAIRVSAPTPEEVLFTITQLIKKVVSALQHVAKEESLSLPKELAERIAEQSERNLRKAIQTGDDAICIVTHTSVPMTNITVEVSLPLNALSDHHRTATSNPPVLPSRSLHLRAPPMPTSRMCFSEGSTSQIPIEGFRFGHDGDRVGSPTWSLRTSLLKPDSFQTSGGDRLNPSTSPIFPFPIASIGLEESEM